MTTGTVVVVVLLGAVLLLSVWGLLARQRRVPPESTDVPLPGIGQLDPPEAWSEGETAGLLDDALDGQYAVRGRYLADADHRMFLLLRAAVPQHFVLPRVRLGDLIQVKIGPRGMERLRLYRKVADTQVGFAVVDRDSRIVAAVDLRDATAAVDPRRQRVDLIKQRCFAAAGLRYVVVDSAELPRYAQLRARLLGVASEPQRDEEPAVRAQ